MSKKREKVSTVSGVNLLLLHYSDPVLTEVVITGKVYIRLSHYFNREDAAKEEYF